VALPGHSAVSALHVLLQRLLPEAHAVHSPVLLLRLRRLLCQAAALHQTFLVHWLRRLLLQADANHIALLCAAGINLRSARLLQSWLHAGDKRLQFS
jgi:hypothetical protein